jgi:DNA adenine methylase
MHYWGGKHYIAKQLSDVIVSYASDKRIVESFCGALNVTKYLQPAIANDINKNLIDMYIQWQSGWRPREITAAEYGQIIKTDSFERGFYGVGASFSGKWCNAFIGTKLQSNSTHTYTMGAANSLARKMEKLGNTQFTSVNYTDIAYEDGDVIYCDPPYDNTDCAYAEAFDSVRFWEWVGDNRNNYMFFISEFTAPDWTKCVWEQNTTIRGSSLRKKATEKLFTPN